jgi:hypothetical protein
LRANLRQFAGDLFDLAAQLAVLDYERHDTLVALVDGFLQFVDGGECLE